MRQAAWASGAVACLLAAGCSDGGSVDPLDGFPPEPRSFEALADLGNAIQNDSASLGFTDPASLPTAGSATYTGVLGLFTEPGTPGLTEADAMIGDLRITADFGDEAVSGLATNFVTDLDERLTGEIAFSDGFIDPEADVLSEFTFGAVASGALTTPDGTTWDVLEGSIDGDFFGTDRGTAGGVADMDFATDGVLGPIVDTDGIFDVRAD